MLLASIILFLILVFTLFYFIGKQFALRDKLQKVDAIVCLAGTRGNIEVLHERIETAIALYKKELAPKIIMSSKFSKKVTKEFKQLDLSEINKYAKEGRITKDHVDFAYNNWDLDLGADYMKQYAVKKGVPSKNIIVENQSLHTGENAKFTTSILEKYNFKSIILVTSPFHQKRAFEEFSKILSLKHIRILNYAATSKRWNDFWWFISLNNLVLVFKEAKRIIQYKN